MLQFGGMPSKSDPDSLKVDVPGGEARSETVAAVSAGSAQTGLVGVSRLASSREPEAKPEGGVRPACCSVLASRVSSIRDLDSSVGI